MYPTLSLETYTFSTHALSNFLVGAFFLAIVLVRLRPRRRPDSIHQLLDSGFYIIIGVVIGAWTFYTLPFFLRWIFGSPVPERWWALGTHWMGYVVGGMVGGYYVCKRYDWDFWNQTDAFAPPLALALGLGRSGCILAGDAFGKVTTSWVGMYLPDPGGNWALRYPTQYVSAALNILLALGLWGFEYYTQNKLSKPLGWPFPGFLFLLYVEIFCIQRFIFEFWRADNPTFFGPLHWTHFYCLLGVIWGMVMMLKLKGKQVVGNKGFGSHA